MNRLDALDAAKRAVADRPNQYGAPEQNFERIAALWNAHIGNVHDDPCNGDETYYTVDDVAIMLALVKIARLEADPSHADSWIDLAGYAGCGAEVSGAGDPKHFSGCECPEYCQPKPYKSMMEYARELMDKPAQNSDLVDDVLQRNRCVIGTDCEICFPKPESKFGFTVGETVNFVSCAEGDAPGKVIGFGGSGVIVRAFGGRKQEWGSVHPTSLRHGP